jgi:class 3 adenylate cyclase
MAMLERCSATPTFARTYVDAALSVDFTPWLPSIQAPTRVLYAPTGREPESVVRRVAELIPNSAFYTLAPTPPGASIGEAYVEVWRHVAEAATGATPGPESDRFLGTMLFTDLVSSTELLTRLGDSKYRELRATHERQVRLQVEQAGGRLVSVTGDGTFSVFDGPSKAVRCAAAICAGADELDVKVRAGVHTGELERTGHDVTGLAVHIGARIGALARPGEVLVSRTVHDLVTGSGLSFAARGTHQLKGVPGRWELYALASAADQPAELPVEQSIETMMDRAALQTARKAPRAMRTALRVGNAVQRYRARTRATVS